MRKILCLLLFLAFLIPFSVVGIMGEGLKYTRAEVEEWNPLDIELQTSSSNFLKEIEGNAQFLRFHRIEGYKQKLKDTTRVYTFTYKSQDAYMMVDFEDHQVTAIYVYVTYKTWELRQEGIDIIWYEFLDYEYSMAVSSYAEQWELWYRVIVNCKNYDLTMEINVVPIIDYGPWAILLTKYGN